MGRILRRLFRVRAFTFAAVPTLALSIGATTAVFSVVDAVLIRPLPYPQSDRLVDLSHTLEVSGAMHVDQSDASFLYYRRANQSFVDIGAYAVTAVNLGPLREGSGGETDRASRTPAARISAGAFGVLRIGPLQGRVFRDDEDRPDSPRVVLIGERLWRSAYGARPDIVGRHVDVDGVSREIIGVMPTRFRFPAAETALWIPIGIDPAQTDSAQFDYRGIARLRDGVSIASAQSDLQRLLLQLPDAIPGRLNLVAIQRTKMQTVVTPLRDAVIGDIGRVLWVALGVVACILLIGCANIATLFLVRADARQPEMAVRVALGAGRFAILREVLSEAAALAVVAGALAVALAAGGIAWLQSLDTAIDLPRLGEAGLDASTLGVAIGLTAVVALLVSALPALRASAVDPALVLHDGGRSMTVGRHRHRLRRALVAAQMALALILVSAAGLMARSFAELSKVQPGFDPAPVYTFRMALPASAYPAREDAVRLVERALGEIAAVNGVEAAGAATKLPLVEQGRLDSGVFIKDRPQPLPIVRPVTYVSPLFFRALSIPFVDGATFDPMTSEKVLPQAIVSESFAHRYWGNERAVGRQVRIDLTGGWLTVVGVVGSVRGAALEQPPEETIYLPLEARDPRWSTRDFVFVVRSLGSPSAIEPQIVQTLRALAPTIPIYAATPMFAIMSHARARTSFLLLLLAITSVIALTLGAVGMFGMTAYAVSLRRREIAIRLALGASPSEVRRMIGVQGLIVAVTGVALGLAGAAVATRALAALLFGVRPADPLTLVVAATLMLVVSLAATWLPAFRASRIDPTAALRSE